MFRKLAQDERGNVSLLGAASLIAIVGLAAFAVELGQGYSARVENQRVADTAALGAALAYSGSEDVAVLTATAQSIAAAQGILASQVAAALIDSPVGGGGKAVQVTVTTPLVLRLARVFTSNASMNISARSIASLSGGGPACILALSNTASNGISANGGTSVTATECGMAANMNINTVGSAKLIAKTVRTGGSVSSSGGSSVTTAPTPNKITQNVANAAVDPLAGSSDVSSAIAQIGTYTNVLSGVAATGSDYTLDYNPPNSLKPFWNSGTSTYTFPAGIYTIKKLKLSGGIKAVFQGYSTITISGGIDHGGASLTFGDRPLTVVGETKIGGGTTLTIGAGRHYFGQITVGGGSIMTVGAGDVDIDGAIDLAGGSTLTFGDGHVAIGTGSGSTKDKSIFMSGTSTLSFGDGTFSAEGSITTQGGSKITFGKTSNHYINGNLDIKGAAKLGEGRYTVNGDFTDGTGGTTWPTGTMLGGKDVGGYDVAGINVTLVISGKLDLGGGAKVYLTAPGDSSSGGISNVLVANTDGDAFSFGGGSASIMSGMLYAPNSTMTMSGGATLSSGGGCFMLVADTISMKGGSAGATICPGMGGGSSAEVMLLQ